jgi:hypothetical protein
MRCGAPQYERLEKRAVISKQLFAGMQTIDYRQSDGDEFGCQRDLNVKATGGIEEICGKVTITCYFNLQDLSPADFISRFEQRKGWKVLVHIKQNRSEVLLRKYDIYRCIYCGGHKRTRDY